MLMAMIFPASATIITNEAAIENAVKKYPDTLWLCDGFAPKEHGCFLLLFSSPNPKIWSDWGSKDPVFPRRFMPLVDYDELKSIRDACFPTVSLPDLQQTYSWYGGQIRPPLRFNNPTEIERHIEEHIVKRPISVLIEEVEDVPKNHGFTLRIHRIRSFTGARLRMNSAGRSVKW